MGVGRYRLGMCRSIKTLRTLDHPATDEEVAAAALQFVRKLSGYRQPAARNADTFNAAVDEIAEASRRLLDGLVPIGARASVADATHAHDHEHGVAHEHAHG
jgi:hypothetical protein